MRVIIMISLLVFSVWASHFDDAVLQAQKTNKKILLELVMESCPYCERMETLVLSKEDVKTLMNEHFILVVLDIHKDTIPEQFTSRMTPTFYFVASDGETILHEIKGAPAKSEFINQLKYAATLKEKP